MASVCVCVKISSGCMKSDDPSSKRPSPQEVIAQCGCALYALLDRVAIRHGQSHSACEPQAHDRTPAASA
eukprot:1295446-Amphidinium_carterae.2